MTKLPLPPTQYVCTIEEVSFRDNNTVVITSKIRGTDILVTQVLKHKGGLMDSYLAVGHALPERSKAIIKKYVHEQNPHLRGAHVSDMLEAYDEHDGFLWLTEPMWEVMHKEWSKGPIPIEFYCVAAIAVALVEIATTDKTHSDWREVVLRTKFEGMVLATTLLANEAYQRHGIATRIDEAVRNA